MKKQISGRRTLSKIIKGWEDPLGQGMATNASILVWRIPWTEKPDKLSMGVTKSQTSCNHQTTSYMLNQIHTISPWPQSPCALYTLVLKRTRPFSKISLKAAQLGPAERSAVQTRREKAQEKGQQEDPASSQDVPTPGNLATDSLHKPNR